MNTIAEKISYLNETKQKFKNRINSLGGEITDSTSFRDYLVWTKDFYNNVSSKTDMFQNGIVGRTNQDATVGKNLCKIHAVASKGITSVYDEKTGTITYSGTTTSSYPWFSDAAINTIPINTEITASVKELRAYITYIRAYDSEGTYQNIAIPANQRSVTITTNRDVVRLVVMDNTPTNTTINGTLQIQLELGFSATDFEPFTYGASPNPDYPQPINNLSGDVAYKVSGKNLFDEEFRQGNSYNTFITDRIYSNKDVFVEEGKTYTFSTNLNTNTFKWAINISETPHPNSIQVYDSGWKTTSSFTFTASVSGYLGIPIAKSNGTDNLTPSDVSSYNFQLEEGSTASSYEPYISQTFNIPLKSKNLFDKDNTDIIDNYYLNDNGNQTSNNNFYIYDYTKVLPNTTYSLQPYRNYTACYCFYDSNKTFISAIRIKDINTNFTTPNNCQYIRYSVRKSDVNELQLEESSTPTTYEPYYDIELCKIDTYEDKIYSSNGRFYLKKGTAKTTITLADTITHYGGNHWVSLGKPRDSIMYGATNFNRYKLYLEKAYYSVPYSIYSYQTGVAAFTMGIMCKENEDVTALKNLVDGSLMYYPLSIPTTTEITQENYPLLYNALKQIQDYLTAYKINKEFILGYSSPEIEY